MQFYNKNSYCSKNCRILEFELNNDIIKKLFQKIMTARYFLKKHFFGICWFFACYIPVNKTINNILYHSINTLTYRLNKLLEVGNFKQNRSQIMKFETQHFFCIVMLFKFTPAQQMQYVENRQCVIIR